MGVVSGMTIGSSMGTAIVPVVGTIIGGIVGSVIGGLYGGWATNQIVWDKKIAAAAKLFAFKRKELKNPNIFNVEMVHKRYKKQVKLYHPDFEGTKEKFIEFNANYKLLLDYAEEISGKKNKKE